MPNNFWDDILPSTQPERRTVTLSEEQLYRLVSDTAEKAARKAAQEAIEATLLSLGVDHINHLEVQKDMQHLRSWRVASESIQRKAMLTMVGLVVSSLLAVIWIGFKEMLR